MKHLYLSILLALFLPAHMQAQSCPAPFAMAKYTIGTDGFTVSFLAESCDPDIKYRWDFGDGASTTYAENNREPVHVYTSDGLRWRGKDQRSMRSRNGSASRGLNNEISPATCTNNMA